MSKIVNIKNKKANFEYELIDKFEAGLQITGAEIKSIRSGKASINEAYCFLNKSELWIRNMHISQYEPASYNNTPPTRDRKLLLNRQEIDKLEKEMKNKGYTIIPLRVYISESGFAKVQIALARGKKIHDKRQSLKDKDDKRAIDRALKN